MKIACSHLESLLQSGVAPLGKSPASYFLNLNDATDTLLQAFNMLSTKREREWHSRKLGELAPGLDETLCLTALICTLGMRVPILQTHSECSQTQDVKFLAQSQWSITLIQHQDKSLAF